MWTATECARDTQAAQTLEVNGYTELQEASLVLFTSPTCAAQKRAGRVTCGSVFWIAFRRADQLRDWCPFLQWRLCILLCRFYGDIQVFHFAWLQMSPRQSWKVNEFPMINFLTNFNLNSAGGGVGGVVGGSPSRKTCATGIKQPYVRLLPAFSGELERSYRGASVLNYSLNIKLLCSWNSLIRRKCRGFHSAGP